MKQHIFEKIQLQVYTWNELDENSRGLISKAKSSLEKAYAPYSGFMVGAAVLLDNGTYLVANNQENACYPVGICAERVVLSYAHANYPESRFVKLGIAAKKANDPVYASVTPCGLCRQTISEYELKFGEPISIYMYSPNGKILMAEGIDQLLPYKFGDINSG